MALIDEYKQAIKDVLDGRAKPAPKPSELPETEDKLATLWAAASAELLADEAASAPNKFLVTLTPTALDYSGTMDKTPQEITAAVEAGMDVVLDIPAMDARVDADQYIYSFSLIRAGAKVFFDYNSSPVLITIVTSGISDDRTYFTNIYSLTPAS